MMRLTISSTGQTLTPPSATHHAPSGRRRSGTERMDANRITRVRRRAEVIDLGLNQSELRPIDTQRLRSELVSFHKPGVPPRLVLSMRGLEGISGCCVGMLAEVAQSLSRVGGALVLRDVPSGTARMLKRSGLSRTLRVARSGPHARRLVSSMTRRTARAA